MRSFSSRWWLRALLIGALLSPHSLADDSPVPAAPGESASSNTALVAASHAAAAAAPRARSNTCKAVLAALVWGSILAVSGFTGVIVHDQLTYNGPEIFPKEENLCCACQWQHFPECASPRSPKTCMRLKVPPFNYTECAWHDEECMSRNRLGCKEWFDAKAQSGCKTKYSSSREMFNWDHALAGTGQAGCTTFRYASRGHGRGCIAAVNDAETLATKAPAAITRLQVDDGGCSTFQSPAQDQPQVETLLRVAGSREIVMSGNQCHSGGPCQPRMIYRVHGGSVTAAPGACQRERDHCYQHDIEVPCQKSGRITRQRCCCKDPSNKSSCNWRLEAPSCG